MKTALEQTLGDKVTVKFSENLNPLIKIYGIDNDFSKEELIQDICERNNIQQDSFNIEYIYPKRKNSKCIKLRLKSDLYMKIAHEKSLHIGYQNCTNIHDDYNINQCNKCQGYNHSFVKCTKIKCSFCAGDHKSEECDNKKEKKCVNCIHANQFLIKNRKVDHEATDKINCDTYKVKVYKVINITNYPMEPAFNIINNMRNLNG